MSVPANVYISNADGLVLTQINRLLANRIDAMNRDIALATPSFTSNDKNRDRGRD